MAHLNAILVMAAILGVAVPLLLAAFAPRRLLLRGMLFWLIMPAIAYVAILLWEGATRSGIVNPLANAMLGFSLLSAILLVPWLVLNGLGYLIGLVLRRLTIGGTAPSQPRRPATVPMRSYVAEAAPDSLDPLIKSRPKLPGAKRSPVWKRAVRVSVLLMGAALVIGTMTLLTESLKQQRRQTLTPTPQIR